MEEGDELVEVEDDDVEEEEANERLRSSGRGRKEGAAPPKRGSTAAGP